MVQQILIALSKWRKEQLKHLLDKFKAKNVNTDEMGLYYKLVLNKSLVMKSEFGHGIKRAKQRITVFLATNTRGTEKLSLLNLGQSPKPRCFKGLRRFPTICKSNHKA